MDETESAENLHRRALNKTADILARRDHSEKELREKLSRFFPPDLIETVVSEARERRWLAPPEELARSAARSWGRTQKSAQYIREQLKKRGLPEVAFDAEDELAKMKTLLRRKFRFTDPETMNLNDEDRLKARRLLKSRGFTDDLIRKVIQDEL